MKENKKALGILMKAREIREATLGKNHYDTAISYNDIGNVHYDMEEYQKFLDM